jgi:rhamnosyltransferase
MKILAGIVTYNPDIERLRINLDSVHKQQFDGLVIVDNGSKNVGEIEKISDNITLIRNKGNEGIAKALNQIFEYAEDKGCDLVVTLDQDSVCPEDYLKKFILYFELEFGMLCPVIIDINAGVDARKTIDFSTDIQEVKGCITSGSITKVSAWKKVNGFDESMFIDSVDYDFCDRIIGAGYKVLRVNTIKLNHEIGHQTRHKLFGINIYVKNHSAFRKYFIGRNIAYIARKRHQPLIRPVLQEIKQLLLIIFYEDEKRKKARALLNGAKEGFHAEIPNIWK